MGRMDEAWATVRAGVDGCAVMTVEDGDGCVLAEVALSPGVEGNFTWPYDFERILRALLGSGTLAHMRLEVGDEWAEADCDPDWLRDDARL